MTKEELADWCGDYNCTYDLTMDGQILNTGECPFLCDQISESINSAKEVLDVTDDAESYHPQLLYQVNRNGCSLYKVIDSKGVEIVIAYYRFGED